MIDSNFTQVFDTEELLHLAAHAGTAGNVHTALAHLKELLQREPKHARALYLLGAQHAEIGLFPRAIAEMKAALSIEPGFEIARLQLGLLLLDRHQLDEAKQQLSQLAGSAMPALRLYSAALIALADDQLPRARELLGQGLKQTPINAAMSALMKRIYDGLENQAATTAANSQDAAANRVFLGAYRDAS